MEFFQWVIPDLGLLLVSWTLVGVEMPCMVVYYTESGFNCAHFVEQESGPSLKASKMREWERFHLVGKAYVKKERSSIAPTVIG